MEVTEGQCHSIDLMKTREEFEESYPMSSEFMASAMDQPLGGFEGPPLWQGVGRCSPCWSCRTSGRSDFWH